MAPVSNSLSQSLSHSLFESLGDPSLLALALAVSVFCAWLSFQLFWRAAGDAVPVTQLITTLTSSVALGGGLWAAHFIALLALAAPGALHLRLGLALLSTLPGMLSAFAAFVWLRQRGTGRIDLAIAGVLIGVGVASVELSGPLAVQGVQEAMAISLSPLGTLVSLVTASLFATAALGVALRRPRRLLKLKAEACLTLAGMVMGTGALASPLIGRLGAGVELLPQGSAVGDVVGGVISTVVGTDSERFVLAMSVALATVALTAFAVAANAFMRYREVYRDVRAKETWHRALLDTAVDGVIAFDIDGRIVDCNTAAEHIFGWSCAELTGRSLGMLIPVGDHTRIELRQLVDPSPDEASGTPRDSTPAGVTREVQGRRRDGSIVPLRVATGHAQLGGHDRFVAFVSDMTARKAMEQALRDSETQMRSLVGNVPGAVYRRRIDPATQRLGSFVFMSEAVARITGHPAADFLGDAPARRMSTLIHADDLASVKAAAAQAVTDRLPFSVEYRMRHADGGERWIWSQGSPVVGPDGRLQWLDGAVLDITQRHDMESELRDAKDRAERAADARSAFLANMSHEIRTPMNSILGFTDVLLQGKLAADQRRHLDTVRTAGQSLLRLLNEILDTAKLDRGEVGLELSDFDLLALVDELSSSLGMEARRKGLTLEVRFHAELERRVHGDPLRVRQVLTNLIANAVKFTEAGGVVLDVLPDAGRVHFAIRDTGIGIPAHRLAAIFDPFVQADVSMSRRFGGTGLGTTISKRLVELMGGDISVESTLGAGSSFHVRLPLPAAHAAAPSRLDTRRANSVPLPPLHVLIADDVPQNIELLGLHLSMQGHRSTSAVNGAEAARLAADQHFDLVLMDVQMPELDGLQATRRIRERERALGLPPVPVIALTASVLDADRRAARECGMDGFASKPVDIEALTREMARVLGLAADAPVEDAAPSSRRVLDTAQGLTRWMDRHDAYRRELRRFAAEQADLGDALVDGMTRAAHAETAALAHRARGAAANLGLDQVAESLRTIEETLRGDQPADADAAVRGFPRAMAAALAAIDTWLLADAIESPSMLAPLDGPVDADERELHDLAGTLAQALRRGVIDETALERLTRGLQGRADPHRLRQLRQAIEDFDFDLAEQRLDAIGSTLAPRRPSTADAVDIEIL